MQLTYLVACQILIIMCSTPYTGISRLLQPCDKQVNKVVEKQHCRYNLAHNLAADSFNSRSLTTMHVTTLLTTLQLLYGTSYKYSWLHARY